MILALSRPDQRKNISALVTAYGESRNAADLANLVIVAGNRDDIDDLEMAAREVLTELLPLDRPPRPLRQGGLPQTPCAGRCAGDLSPRGRTRGVFVNPALTEPFGLTLIEAAAIGLPIVATEDGGPRDIIANCRTVCSSTPSTRRRSPRRCSRCWRTRPRGNGVRPTACGRARPLLLGGPRAQPIWSRSPVCRAPRAASPPQAPAQRRPDALPRPGHLHRPRPESARRSRDRCQTSSR